MTPAKRLSASKKFAHSRRKGYEFLFSGGRQAVVAAVAPRAIRFPVPFHKASFLKLVEHGIERRQLEMQRATGILFNALCNFEAV